MCPATNLNEARLGDQGLDRLGATPQLLGDGPCGAHALQYIMGGHQFSHHHIVDAAKRAALADDGLSIAFGSLVSQ